MGIVHDCQQFWQYPVLRHLLQGDIIVINVNRFMLTSICFSYLLDYYVHLENYLLKIDKQKKLTN